MANDRIPLVPQTGRLPITLTPLEEQRLLSTRTDADQSDLFVNDSDPDVRKLGRLALRRDIKDPGDSFALGDRCAVLSFRDDQLRIWYIGKTLAAYRRAAQVSTRSSDKELAERAIRIYIEWVVQVAQRQPTTRNIGAALWAAAEVPPRQQSLRLRAALGGLAQAYASAEQPPPADRRDRDTVEVPSVNLRGAMEDDARGIPPDVSVPYNPRELRGDDDDDGQPREIEDATAFGAEGLTARALLTDAAPEPADMQATSEEPPPVGGFSAAPAIHVTPPDSTPPGDFRAREWLFDRDPGVQRDRYEIRRVLRGGMGVVYICRDLLTEQPIAIKTFQGKYLDNERAVARFEQEARIWISLDKHPNIVQARKIQNFGSQHAVERPHLLLEYIAPAEGHTPDLRSWIDAGPMAVETVISIGIDICRGMQHACQKFPGLVHRDLKPGNILVRYDGVAKVTDFGLVRTLERTTTEAALDDDLTDEHHGARLTRANAVVGTPAYMSPEQCRAEEADMRSDIYAFGVILYEMLTGRPIFVAQTASQWVHAHLSQFPAFPPDLPVQIPTRLATLVMRCVAKDPANRPQSWETLLNDLSLLFEAELGVPPPPLASTEMALSELMDKAYGLSEIGFHTEAIATYDQALDSAPPDKAGWVWSRKANTLRISGQFEPALEAFDRGLNLDPTQAWAWFQRGVVLERLRRDQDAADSYRRAIDLRPNDMRVLLNRVRLLLRSGASAEAEADARRVIDIAPGRIDAHVLLAQTVAARQRHVEALELYDNALVLSPSAGWAWYGKGKLLRQVGRQQEAVEAFREAARWLPDQQWAWMLLASTLAELERNEEALAAIQQVTLRAAPNSEYGWVQQGLILEDLKRADDALSAFDQALRLNPRYYPAVRAKSALLEKLQRYQEALAVLDESITSAPDSGVLWAHRGALAVTLKAFEQAVHAYEHAVQAEPSRAQWWERLGYALRRSNQAARALNAYRRAVTLDPDYAWAWNELGLTLSSLQQYAEALGCFTQAATLQPRSVWFIYNKANTLLQLNHYAESMEALDQALDIDDHHAETWLKRGQALRKMGRFKEALTAFEQAVELVPTDGRAWNYLGLALSDMKRFEDALDSYAHAALISPTTVWFHLNQIDPLLALGRQQGALDACETALRLAPTSARILVRKGDVLLQMQRYEPALEAYDEALRADPTELRALHGKSKVYRALGDSNAALTQLTIAVERHPQQAWVWVVYGETLVDLKQYREAIGAFNMALEVEPQHPTAARLRNAARKQLEATDEE